jgi:hypothetical protein
MHERQQVFSAALLLESAEDLPASMENGNRNATGTTASSNLCHYDQSRSESIGTFPFIIHQNFFQVIQGWSKQKWTEGANHSRIPRLFSRVECQSRIQSDAKKNA